MTKYRKILEQNYYFFWPVVLRVFNYFFFFQTFDLYIRYLLVVYTYQNRIKSVLCFVNKKLRKETFHI